VALSNQDQGASTPVDSGNVMSALTLAGEALTSVPPCLTPKDAYAFQTVKMLLKTATTQSQLNYQSYDPRCRCSSQGVSANRYHDFNLKELRRDHERHEIGRSFHGAALP
jgi:hypothetical protein